jgi:uncharacterized membrane protein SpoIIM required for sporulation
MSQLSLVLNPTFLAATAWEDFAKKVTNLFTQLRVPIIAILASAAFIVGVWIGLQFLLAGGDEQKLKKAKTSAKYLVIGLIAIFLIAALVPVIISAMQQWME